MIKKFLLALALLPTFLNAQHEVSGTFLPVENFTYVFLYHSTPTGANYVNRSEVSDKGRFSIALDSTQPKGIYKLVYALPPEDNNFDIIYNGEENITVHFNSEKGIEFSESRENKLWSSYQKSMEAINTSINTYYSEGANNKNDFKSIFNTLKDAQNAFEEAAKGTMALQFIEANKPYIPITFEDYKTYTNNVKTHFLDHINFSNLLLQSSNFLNNKVTAFIFGMSEDDNETFKSQIDILANKIHNTPEVKTAILEQLWQEFVNKGNETIANYITDNHLLKLAEIQQNTNLTTMLTTFRNNSIGQVAQDFDLTVTKNGTPINTTLHNLDAAKQYLIIFWSSTCGHCLQELPKVEALLETIPKKDLMVIAFGMENDEKTWLETIKKFPRFTHVLGLQKWDNPIGKAYGVNATPSYYLLDKDKKILDKPYNYEALKEVLK